MLGSSLILYEINNFREKVTLYTVRDFHQYRVCTYTYRPIFLKNLTEGEIIREKDYDEGFGFNSRAHALYR